MARKRELTRIQAEGKPKWRKIYHGKKYHFRGSYEEAIVLWHKKLVELETEADEAQPSEGEIRWLKANDPKIWVRKGDESVPLDWAKLSPEKRAVWLARLQATLEWNAMSPKSRAILEDRFKMENPHVKTLASAVDAFLTRSKTRVALGERSAGRYDTLQRCIHHFAKFVGGASGVNRVNGAMLEAYHSHLAEELQANKWSSEYAQFYIAVAKQFVRWCYQTELLDTLPRNLESKELNFSIKPKKIPTFTTEEVKSLLANATDRMRLYLLLMVNCGMTQKDISDLHPSEVDWTNGRIIRRRSKTRDKNTPTISYPLWKDTFRLLKRFGNREGERVLLNQDEKPLKTEELRDDKCVKVDNIAVSYFRLWNKLKKQKALTTRKSLKLLRKTSPNILGTKPEYAHCAIHFLADSPRGVMYRHYIQPDQASVDRAVVWLGQQYGVE